MAFTNFAALTTEQKTVWSRDIWRAARNASFLNNFVGTGNNAMIQRITELTKDEKGSRCVLTLVADNVNDGIVGDNQLQGNEEALQSMDQVIRLDQLRNAHKHKGRFADQKSVVTFRTAAKDNLAYWLGNTIDQIAFLTLSGVGYNKTNNGADRSASSQLSQLEFAADVTAPSVLRHRRWDSAGGGSLQAGDTTAIDATDTPTYAMLVEAKAHAVATGIKGVKSDGNMEHYHVFLHPRAMAKLKRDADYLANVRFAGPRDNSNPLFNGSVVMQDGLILHEFRHVYNTTGAASGSKWGSGSTVDGCRILLCGAQALGFADLGNPYWDEDLEDLGNRPIIAVGKMFGMKKPKFKTAFTNGSTEDFGVLCIDVAI